jgi:23S rRNA pseudouridine1911/1915/1917 synthase
MLSAMTADQSSGSCPNRTLAHILAPLAPTPALEQATQKKPGTVWKWTVPAGLDPSARADREILKAAESSEPALELTRSQLKRLMEEGQVTTTQGKVIKPNSRLKSGDEILIRFPPPVPSELVAEDRPLDVLYEDEHLLIINKPQGLTVHPSSTQMEGTLVHALLHHIRDLSGIGGVLRPGIVHRIDKNTSGALVITKTDQAHIQLSEIFSKHEIERCYWALCYGAPPSDQALPGKIESRIGRNPTDRKKMTMKTQGGKIAITHYQVQAWYRVSDKPPFASWMSVTLETGRTHQIRVHLTGIGYSILGDPVYGVPSERHPKWTCLPEEIQNIVRELPGQALHARTLGFSHPITGKFIRVEAEPPEVFRRLLQSLEAYSEKVQTQEIRTHKILKKKADKK